MVCKKCEKKLAKLVVPDKWKDGSRNSDVGAGPSKRPLATNTALGGGSRVKKSNPYGGKCELCKKPLHQAGKYCHGCAYSRGVFHDQWQPACVECQYRVCNICGKQVLQNLSSYKQSKA